MDVSSRQQAGSEESGRVCDICVRSRSISRAVYGYCVDCRDYLCNDCFHTHNGNTSSVNNKLVEGNQEPAIKSCPVDMCQTHPNEKILYFCKEHSALACQKCAYLHHRVCEGISDIATLSRGQCDVKRCCETRKQVTELEAKIDKIRQTWLENLSKIDSNKTKMKSDIQNFCKRLHDHLHKMEEKMIDKADEMDNEYTSSMDAILHECDTVNADLNIVVDDLETKQDPNRRVKLFISVFKAAAAVDLLQHKVTTLNNSNTVHEQTFTPNVSLARLIDDVNSLGDLSLCNVGSSLGALPDWGGSQTPLSQTRIRLTPRWNYDNVTVETGDVINVRTQSDKNTCNITGSAMLEGDTTLAIADNTNACVKLVDIGQRKVVSQICLSSSPWDITLIQPDQLAVILPGECNLQIISVNGTSLSLAREMNVPLSCRGITHHNGRLFVSCNGDPPQIQILNMSGSVLNTVSRQTDGQFPCALPHYLTYSVAQSSLFVTDWGSSSLHCLDINCKVNFTFMNHSLREPRGVTVADDGTVIVCSYGYSNLFMISSNGKRGKVLIDGSRGAQKPMSVTYNSILSTLFVGLYNSDVLKVFSLKDRGFIQ